VTKIPLGLQPGRGCGKRRRDANVVEEEHFGWFAIED
jgi:hypothetical protein